MAKRDPGCEKDPRTVSAQVVVLLEAERLVEERVLFEACSFVNGAVLAYAHSRRGPCDPYCRCVKFD